MDTSRMTTRLVGAALAALVLLPATAQAAAVAPLKPCYVSATHAARESVNLSGNGFTPGSLVDISFSKPQPDCMSQVVNMKITKACLATSSRPCRRNVQIFGRRPRARAQAEPSPAG